MKKSKICIAVILVLFSFFTLFSCQQPLPPQQIKNIIIMIGDGMGPDQEEAGRRYLGGDLIWDSFPYQGTLITNNFYGEVTDSAAAATALATGVKTTNSSIRRDRNGNVLKGIMQYAQEDGRKTGVVSSKFLYDATPASFSGSANTRGDYGTIMPLQISSGINLLIGEASGGYDSYQTQIDEAGYTYIKDGTLLNDNLDAEKILAPLPSIVPTATAENQIQLNTLTEFALNFLECEEGFVLMVEGGKIDERCHAADIEGTINELLAFNEAVKVVYEWAKDRDDTVIIVTADHETNGLYVYPDADSSNILDGTHISWFGGGGHTSTPVLYHSYGAKSNNVKELFDEILKLESDNTDIFKICKALLELEVNATENA